MAINLAGKYSDKVAERFQLKSLTDAAVNKNYDWSGVNTVTVYSIPTAQMTDYTKTGDNRYGIPSELEPTDQTLTITKQRSFTYTIDRLNFTNTQHVNRAGKSLARQIDEVIVPEIDAYRLSKIVTSAVSSNGFDTEVITSENAYSSFLNGVEYLGNNKVPNIDRIMFCTYTYYNLLKQDQSFIKNSDIGQKILINGQMGMVDNVKIVPVPSSYLPTDVAFIIAHPSVTVAADKLDSYVVHENPKGINGWLIEGVIAYDAFVLNSKSKGVYVHKNLIG